jgi:hypothetical protein
MKSFIPPAKYDTVRNWAKEEMFANSVDRGYGAFKPGSKVLFTQEVMNQSTKDNYPCPTKYPKK